MVTSLLGSILSGGKEKHVPFDLELNEKALQVQLKNSCFKFTSPFTIHLILGL